MRELLHIYGPFSIHSYGLAIAIALLIFTFLLKRDPRYHRLDLANKFTGILLVGIIASLIGGRLLCLLGNREHIEHIGDILAFWHGGISVPGSVLGVLITLPLYLKKIGVPIIPFLDLAAIYAPLLLSISRLGCFFAGCCYGSVTTFPWSVIYTDPASDAPLNICLHPTQLYSSITLLFIFVAMYFVLQHLLRKPGQLMTVYLMLTSAERFAVDFFRGDRIDTFVYAISLHQIIALSIFVPTCITFLWISLKTKRHTESA